MLWIRGPRRGPASSKTSTKRSVARGPDADRRQHEAPCILILVPSFDSGHRLKTFFLCLWNLWKLTKVPQNSNHQRTACVFVVVVVVVVVAVVVAVVVVVVVCVCVSKFEFYMTLLFSGGP